MGTCAGSPPAPVCPRPRPMTDPAKCRWSGGVGGRTPVAAGGGTGARNVAVCVLRARERPRGPFTPSPPIPHGLSRGPWGMVGWALSAVGGADGGGLSRTVRLSLRCVGFARLVRASWVGYARLVRAGWSRRKCTPRVCWLPRMCTSRACWLPRICAHPAC